MLIPGKSLDTIEGEVDDLAAVEGAGPGLVLQGAVQGGALLLVARHTQTVNLHNSSQIELQILVFRFDLDSKSV